MTSTTTKSNATRTKNDAEKTARDARNTARSATKDAKGAARQARAQGAATRKELLVQGRRVAGAAQAEVQAVAKQPTRPLMFALGVVDRTVEQVKELPAALRSAPFSLRDAVVDTAATAGDLAERAQRGYTDVAKDGESLVAAVRRQDSTQRALRLAERAQKRGSYALSDTEKAVEAVVDATAEAVSKLG